MNFSEELNKYLNLLHCSPKEFCKASNLSPTIISRYLNNKRTPRVDSKYFEQIVESLYTIATEKNINLDKLIISQTLKESLSSSNVDYDVFVNNFNTLQNELKMTTSNLADALGYDASFISKIKNKSRKPADLDNFIDQLCDYIVLNYNSEENKYLIISILNCQAHSLDDSQLFKTEIFKWLTNSHEDDKQNMLNFLTKLDTFNLNDYIGTDFSKVKVPTSPVILRNSKIYYGTDGRKQAEGDFLKTTLISKSTEPIFFYSDLPIANAGEDEEFKKKWVLAMTMLLKKGLHLNMIHNIDRPVKEMLLGLEAWIPIYMTRFYFSILF